MGPTGRGQRGRSQDATRPRAPSPRCAPAAEAAGREGGAHSWLPSAPPAPAPTQRDGNNNPLRIRPDWFPAPWERRRARRGDPEGTVPASRGRGARFPGATWLRPGRSAARRLPGCRARPPPALTPGRRDPGPHCPPLTSWSSPGGSGAHGLGSGWDAPSGVRGPSRPLGPGPAPSSSFLGAGPHLPKGVSGGTWEGIRTQGGVRAPEATSAGSRSRSPGSQRFPLSPGVGGATPHVPSSPGPTPGLGPLLPAPGRKGSAPLGGHGRSPNGREWPPSPAASAWGAQG